MNQNVRGLLSYLFGWLGGLIVLVAFKDNNDKTKFHACQAITISVLSFVLTLVIGFIPFVRAFSGIVSLLMFVLSVIGMIKAYKEEDYELPLISDLTRNIFKSQLSK